MYNLIILNLPLIILIKTILCNNNTCFEYSCEKCSSPEYGKCTKCRYGWSLIDGTCPCFNSSCAVCTSGFVGTETCQLCKKGFIWDNYNCICNLSNCEQCGENGCLVCKIGYYYNKDTNECEKRSGFKEIYCDEFECDICFSELSGACIKCKQGTKLGRGLCEVLRHVSDYGTCFSSDYYKEGEYCYPNCDGFECPIKYNHSTNLCPSNKCLVCQNNRLNILDECDNYNECSLIEGCLNCISDEECLYCKQGYYLLGGKCKKCIKGCSICYNDYSCEYCLSGFELTSDKQCNLSNNFDFDIVEYNKYKNEF